MLYYVPSGKRVRYAEHRNFPAVIIEVKAAKDAAEDLDALAAEARRQIDEKNAAHLAKYKPLVKCL